LCASAAGGKKSAKAGYEDERQSSEPMAPMQNLMQEARPDAESKPDRVGKMGRH